MSKIIRRNLLLKDLHYQKYYYKCDDIAQHQEQLYGRALFFDYEDILQKESRYSCVLCASRVSRQETNGTSCILQRCFMKPELTTGVSYSLCELIIV